MKYTAQNVRSEVQTLLAEGAPVVLSGHGSLHSPWALDIGPATDSFRVSLLADGRFYISSRGSRGASTANRAKFTSSNTDDVTASGIVVRGGTGLADALRDEIDYRA